MSDVLKKHIAKLSLGQKHKLLRWLQQEIANHELIQKSPIAPVDVSREVVTKRLQDKITYQHELVRCGKPQCRCKSGKPNDLHGPYWYAYQHKNGKVISKYIGKHFKALSAKHEDL